MRPPPLRVWVWTAAALALVVVATLLWRGSSVAATDSTTAPEPAVPDAAPDGELTEAWTAQAGAPLPRRVVEGGRVLVTDEHGFAALDAVTGEEAWHYRRGDARLCDATAVNGLVVAVFRTADRCDEALALTAATGVRAWTRNLSLRGDATLASTDRVVLAAGPTGVVVLDPVGDNVRWRYGPPEGCRLLGSDVGSAGVVVLQRCPGTAALQLRLFDGSSGQARWTRDVAVPEDGTVRLTGADRVVGVVAGDTLLLSRADDGAALPELPLPAATGDPGTELLHQAGAGDLALVWARGTVWALDPATGVPRWQLPALGLPSTGEATGTTDAATVWVPEDGGFVQRDLATGTEVGRSAAGGLVPGGRTAVVGPVLVQRLPDRVIGYR
ncbi:Outer membrane protein assembly factor BamB, contains PQQ-like beta-propeller repeat [Geodermatophilus telluris]|uniref:Outer membrane protein assembly factor BamB, contains PQQ-like beta-propeller repeat n=1 Tax=Geodermatophilus telluris TaxID=1190417 RepID=A0A1G6ID76_9ACTN|nr:PQQ-binding-like beta-propeller repeat protein [Geodermatophilus telluris]SDC04489.1 Outer membrane protein assembly factor BamB, contains PQQ-like beta-propeller repeat [Geodermatophilus telluris]